MNEKVVLAVDPGTSKCGFALVRRDAVGKLSLLWRRIVPIDDIAGGLREAGSVDQAELIVVGSGTGSKNVVQQIRDFNPGKAILVVDEENTTLQARERYWEHHKRRGWRRICPVTLLYPPEPIDDFVALILAERVLLT